MFEIFHFRDSHKILKQKKMLKDVQMTLEYVDDVLNGALYKRELFRQALEEMSWRNNEDTGALKILEGRRYMYKGYKKEVAIEGNFAVYEYILEGLFRLQIGYDKGFIETGILLLTSKRSEKSPYGSSAKMVKEEIELLYPTISLPVSVALFDLGEPEILESNGEDKKNGVSVPSDDN